MALSKQDLKARTLAGMEEEERFQKSNEIKGKITKIVNTARQAAASQEARANKEKDLLGADSKKILASNMNFISAPKNNQEDVSSRVIAPKIVTPTSKVPAFSAKAISSEAPAIPTEKRDYSYIASPMDRGKQTVSDSMALRMGVSNQTLNNIRDQGAQKYGKDIVTESFQSGVANTLADTVGGLEYLYKNIPTVSKSISRFINGEDYNPFSAINNPLQEWQDEKALDVEQAVAEQDNSKGARFASQVVTAGTQMIPDVVLSLATGGASTAATAGTKATKGLKALTSVKNLIPAIKQVAVDTVKNPSFWLNFEQMLSPEYEAAIANGASEKEANITALLSAFAQAKIESATGFQNLPKKTTPSVTKAVIDYVKSAIAEGNEEVLQSITSGIAQKLVYDHDKDWIAKESGEDAVLNMADAYEEWVLGTFLGGVMSAPGAIINAGKIPQTTVENVAPIAEPAVPPIDAPVAENAVPTAEASMPPINATLPNVENVTPTIENNQQVPFANATTANEATNPQNDVIATNEADSNHPNTVGAKESTTPFYTAGVQYGTYDPKANQTYEGNETFESPVRLDESGNAEVSEAVETIAASPIGTPETVDYMIQNINKFTHAIDTDVDSINKAKVFLEENGLEKSLAHWKNVTNGRSKYTKDEGVLAATTIRLLQEQGRINEANEMTAELVAEISTAAQATQGAETLYKILDPAKMKIATNTEYYVKTLTEKLNTTHKDKLKGKTIAVNNDLLQQALQANGTDAEGAAWDKVFADIANQVPANYWERLNNIRYFCMLSNPKTHIRNVVSNTVMQGVNMVKDYVKVAVESVYNNTDAVKSGKMQEVRTVTTKAVPQAYKDFAKADFEVIKNSFDDPGKYSETAGTFVHKHRTKINNNLLLGAVKERFKGDTKTEQLLNKVLDQGVVNSLAELNSYLLNDVEDGKAKSAIYSRALSQYMVANNLTPEYLSSADGESDLQKARAYASAEALYNTFNEKNAISDWLASGSKTSKIVDTLITVKFPFKKVPLNLAKTAFDYSPANLLASSIKMAKAVKTESDPSAAIDGIAKGVTGSGLIIVGAILRSLGYLTNGLSEDDKEANFEKMLGSQAFSFKVGNKSYSLDWLQPVGMMLFSGAAAYDVMKDLFAGESNIIDKDDMGKTIANVTDIGINAILSFYEPIMEMSMLSNVKELVAPEYGRSFNQFLGDIIGDTINQFVPNFLTALTKTIDDTERNAYYVDKTDAVPDSVQIAAQNVMAKIPGLSQMLPEKVDVWGNTKKRNPNVAVRAFENFISPGTYKEYNETKVDEMLKQLYAKTGESSVLPTSFSKNFNVNGETVNLSANQYTDAQKTKGPAAYNILNQLVVDKDFKKLSAENKAEIIKDVYSYATIKGKQKVSDYTTDTKWYKNMEEAQKKENIKPADFLVNRSIYGNLEGSETRSKDMMMYDHLIADKTTSDKEDLAILKYVAGVDFSKYEKATDKPNAILSSYNIIETEEAKGGEGVRNRIYKQLIADKTTTAKEDVAILENVVKVDMKKYKSATTNSKEILDLYGVVSDDAKKEEDLKTLVKKGFSNEEALAKYNVATGTKEYTGGEFKFGRATKQAKKANKLADKGYDPETIAKAANAVTSLGEYGTSKNFKTCKNMLNAVGINDDKFINAFWNIYVNG